MKKKNIIAAALVSALALTSFSVFVLGDDAAYDASSDPLVSLSYVEKITAEQNAKIADLTTRLTALETENASLKTTVASQNTTIDELRKTVSDVTGGYEVVNLKKGDKLFADTVCELILRSGTASVIAPGANGIADLTAASDLADSDIVPLQHSLMIPRGGDGRGILVTSDEIYIMVRGEYHLGE